MQRRLPDVSTTQLIASGVATLAAAWGASYLGVYGTILGAAFMSVASTAGTAVCKYYLDQGKEQLQEKNEETAREAVREATSADPTRTVVWPEGLHPADPALLVSDPGATRPDLSTRPSDPNATRLDPGALYPPGGSDPNATRIDVPVPHAVADPTQAVAGTLVDEAGDEAVRAAAWRTAFDATVLWARQRWKVLLLSSAVVFAIVMGGISLYEWQTGKPIGNSAEKGTTLNHVFGGGSASGDGGGSDVTPTPATSDQDTDSPSTPSTGPSTDPTQQASSEPGPTPTTSVPQVPSSRPTTSTPSRTPTQAPPSTPGGGQEDPGGGQDDTDTGPNPDSTPR
ncbi:hypothetical protein ABZ801_22940 [Actinomadura sp. NPDC047616]|uniref:hypothetical protein n=1 Tax=Actinomadura sp. NPDC047616 TaxID=3155914 RepID=UPI0033D994FC